MYRNRSGRYFTAILCSTCGERIEQATEGMVKFSLRAGEGPCETIFCHKKCDRRKQDLGGWHELDTALVWLLSNLAFNKGKVATEARAKAMFLGSM